MELKKGVNDLDKNIEVIFYEKDQEKKLIEDAFGLVKKYPVLITYNGDGFDLPYLYNRAKRLGISDEINPAIHDERFCNSNKGRTS